MLVSAMLTNVLVHTDADALLVAEVRESPNARRMRVEVSDTSDDPPHKCRPGERASSGRDLMLIELRADAGAPRGEGMSIWFEIQKSGIRETS